MREPIWAVQLDGAGTVLGVRLAQPGRFHRWRDAEWILELPAAWSPPPSGIQLVLGPETISKPLAGDGIRGDDEEDLRAGVGHEGV